MEQASLKVTYREKTGTSNAKQMRRDGFVPGALYGPKSDPLNLTIDPKALRLALQKTGSNQSLINLQIEGLPGGDGDRLAILKDYQKNPLTHQLTHIDLLEVTLGEKMVVSVPLHYKGKAKGVVEGGIVEIKRRSLEVSCLPGDIPSDVVVDISGLEIGDSLHINEIQVPEGVEIVDDEKLTLVTVVHAAQEEVVADTEEKEVEVISGASEKTEDSTS